MNPKLDRGFLALILTTLVVLGIPACVCQNNQQHQTCSQPFECGRLRGIPYPFWGGNRPVSCGYPGFQLDCRGNDPLISISSITHRVLAIDNSTQTLRVSRNDLWDNLCPRFLFNTTLNFSLFEFYPPANDQNITLYYGCTVNEPLPTFLVPNQFNCNVNETNSLSFFLTREVIGQGIGMITCNSQISVGVNQTAARDLGNTTSASTTLLRGALQSGFSIQWSADNENCSKCVGSGGLCGYNQDSASFACHCTTGTFESATCNGTGIDNGTPNGNVNISSPNPDFRGLSSTNDSSETWLRFLFLAWVFVFMESLRLKSLLFRRVRK